MHRRGGVSVSDGEKRRRTLTLDHFALRSTVSPCLVCEQVGAPAKVLTSDLERSWEAALTSKLAEVIERLADQLRAFCVRTNILKPKRCHRRHPFMIYGKAFAARSQSNVTPRAMSIVLKMAARLSRSGAEHSNGHAVTRSARYIPGVSTRHVARCVGVARLYDTPINLSRLPQNCGVTIAPIRSRARRCRECEFLQARHSLRRPAHARQRRLVRVVRRSQFGSVESRIRNAYCIAPCNDASGATPLHDSLVECLRRRRMRCHNDARPPRASLRRLPPRPASPHRTERDVPPERPLRFRFRRPKRGRCNACGRRAHPRALREACRAPARCKRIPSAKTQQTGPQGWTYCRGGEPGASVRASGSVHRHRVPLRLVQCRRHSPQRSGNPAEFRPPRADHKPTRTRYALHSGADRTDLRYQPRGRWCSQIAPRAISRVACRSAGESGLRS
ncbi:hypothetical protein BF49_0281 [Bradyrhizobium sp.]|nr:hypothetical protein BF49_0281 [Bradyrhizobium sp.]